MGFSGPAATVIGASLIALAILFAFRWETSPVSVPDGNPAVVRLDHWTGNVALCDVDVQRSVAARAAYLRCRNQ